MARKHDLSDLGASEIDTSGLADIGAQRQFTPAERLEGAAGGTGEALMRALGGAGRTAGRYGAGLLSGAAEDINRQLLNLPGARKFMPQAMQRTLEATPFQQLEPSAAFQAGQAGGRPIGDVIGYAGVAEPTAGLGEIAPALKYLSTPAGRSLLRSGAMGLYGGLTSPYDRAGGAATGLAAGLGLETLPGAVGAAARPIAKGISKVAARPFGWMMPQQHAEQIMKGLAKDKGIEESAKSVAQDVRGAYKGVKDTASQMYGNVMDRAGDKNIYEKNIPEQGYLSLDPKMTANYPYKAKQANDAFLNKPTFENAHKLQNVLATEARSGEKAAKLSLKDKDTINHMWDARKALLSDMKSSLNEIDPKGGLAKQYGDAASFYKNEVVPFRSTKAISDIAKGEKTNPRNVSTIFKSPEKDMLAVRDYLGPEAHEKIVYNQLGKLGKNPSPERLLKGVENLDKEGLSSYVSPELQDQFDALRRKVSARNIMQRVGGAGIGMAALHPLTGHIPFPLMGEMGAGIGALGGAAYGPRLFGRFATKVPGEAIGREAGRGSRDYYKLLSRALAAHLIKGGQ